MFNVATNTEQYISKTYAYWAMQIRSAAIIVSCWENLKPQFVSISTFSSR